MENYDSAQKYAETSANAFGTANEKYEIYMDSVMAKQNQLRASWEEFYNNLLNSDVIKTLLDIANALLKLMNLGDGFVGKMTLAMTALAGLNMVFNSHLKVFQSLRTMLVGLVGATGSLGASFKSLCSVIKMVITGEETLVGALKAQKIAQKEVNTETVKGNVLAMANPWLAVAEIALTALAIIVTAVKKHNEAIQESIDKAQELKDTYKSTSDEISDNIKSLTETTSVKSDGTEYKSLQEEFDALCKGVDRYGNNLSLTNEEYSRYKSICKQIVDLNPDLMDGYDSEIEAVGNRNGLLQQTIELMQKEQRLKAKEYADSTDEENDSGYTTLEGFQKEYDKIVDKAKKTKEQIKTQFDGLRSNEDYVNQSFGLINNVDNDFSKKYTKAFSLNDKDVEDVINNWDVYSTDIQNAIDDAKNKIKNLDDSDPQKSYYEDFIRQAEAYKNGFQSFIDSVGNNYEKANEDINDAKTDLEENMKSIYSAQAQSNTEYHDLNSDSKQFINGFIESFDLSDTSSEVVANNKKAIDDVVKAFGSDTDLQNEISNLFADSNIDYGKFQDKLNELVPKIKKIVGDKMSEEDIKFKLTPDIDENSLDKIKDTLVKANWDNNGNLSDAMSNVTAKLNEMSVTEIETLSQMDEDTIKACKSWGDLKVAIEDAKNGAKTVTFDSAMSDYANGLQNLQTQYETLSKAQEEYNEYGNLTASTMKKIINAGLLDYLTVVDGQLSFNTQRLQTNADALQQNAIASLNSALYYDLLSIANGTYNSVVSQTDTSGAIQAVDALANHCKTKAGDVLTLTDAVTAFNSATGNKLSVENEDVKSVFNKYSKSVKLVQSLSKNLSAGTYRSTKPKKSGSYSSKKSKSKKSKEEKKFDSLKDKFQADEITINQYISGMQGILKKVKKGSDLYSKIQEELKKQKLDNAKNQYERGEITIDQYIKKLTKLRKEYKKNTEGYKDLTKTINETKADKFADQYERGEISLNKYVKKLKGLRKSYKKNSKEWKKYNDLINKTKLDKYNDQYERDEISGKTYRKNLEKLKKNYKKSSKDYKDICESITDSYVKDIDKGLDKIDTKISKIGNVNTAKEQSKYASLLSEKYKLVNKDIANIRKKLKKNNLTAEQRVTLQEKLNDLLGKEVDIHDEIEDKVRDYYENQKEQLSQQAELTKKQTLYNKEVELYGKGGKDLWEHNNQKEIDTLQSIIDKKEEEKNAQDKINEKQELENNLLEAKLKLQNALNNKTTKILTKQEDGTWAYTFRANMSDVKSAQDELKDAQKALDDYNYEQDLQKIQDKIDELNKTAEDLSNKYDDAEFWANRKYESTMNDIEVKFSDNAIDKLVEAWFKKYGSSDNKLTAQYEKIVKSNASLEKSINDLTTAVDAKYETVNYKRVTSFDTGGEIKGSGIALVHDKERVLTQEQNASFTKLLDNIDSINNLIDVSKVNIPELRKINDINSKSKGTQTIINGVTCNFPNVTTPDGIQKAILELPRLALQQK